MKDKNLYDLWLGLGSPGIMTFWNYYVYNKRPIKKDNGEPYLHMEIRELVTEWKKDLEISEELESIKLITNDIFNIVDQELYDTEYYYIGTHLLPNSDKVLIINNDSSNIQRFGYTSDLHWCCKKCHEDSIYEAYQWLEDEGITTIFNTGDLMTGHNVYRGQQFDTKIIGANAQVEYVAKNHPRVKGATEYILAGNHELAIYKESGTKVLENLSHIRDDIICVGGVNERVDFNGIKLSLVHPGGAGTKSQSLRAQQWVDSLNINSPNNPDILLLGHYHIAMQGNYRGIHYFYGGSFQGFTDLVRKLNVVPVIGCWIIEVEKQDDFVKEVNARFRRFK